MNKLELAICAVFSVLLHFAIAEALEQLPARDPVKPRRVQISVVDAPKPPEVVAPPEPPPPAPEPAPTPPPEAKPQPQPKAETPKPQPPKTQITAVVPETTPTTSTTAVAVETTGDDEPVYSATMSSSSSGTTSGSAATAGGTGAKPGGTGAGGTTNGTGTEPIAAYEATKMPMPRGQCFGKYTDAAKTAGVEGTVVLDLTVSEDGKPREIKVTQGLSHGLDEAAIAAVRACSFSPGEKEGKRVPVRIRGFKITFVLQEAR